MITSPRSSCKSFSSCQSITYSSSGYVARPLRPHKALRPHVRLGITQAINRSSLLPIPIPNFPASSPIGDSKNHNSCDQYRGSEQ